MESSYSLLKRTFVCLFSIYLHRIRDSERPQATHSQNSSLTCPTPKPVTFTLWLAAISHLCQFQQAPHSRLAPVLQDWVSQIITWPRSFLAPELLWAFLGWEHLVCSHCSFYNLNDEGLLPLGSRSLNSWILITNSTDDLHISRQELAENSIFHRCWIRLLSPGTRCQFPIKWRNAVIISRTPFKF